MVVTVTVWLGWSYCTDSVFAVTSRSSSSASSVEGGHRTGCRPQAQETRFQPLPTLDCNGPLYFMGELLGSPWLQNLASQTML